MSYTPGLGYTGIAYTGGTRILTVSDISKIEPTSTSQLSPTPTSTPTTTAPAPAPVPIPPPTTEPSLWDKVRSLVADQPLPTPIPRPPAPSLTIAPTPDRPVLTMPDGGEVYEATGGNGTQIGGTLLIGGLLLLLLMAGQQRRRR